MEVLRGAGNTHWAGGAPLPGGPSPSTAAWAASPSGVNEVDYGRYPGRESQLQWLRYYLQAQKGMAVTPREVERLYVQVNKFALVSACWGGRRRRDPLPTALLSQPRVEEVEARGRCEGLGPQPMLPNPALEVRPGKSPLGHPQNTEMPCSLLFPTPSVSPSFLGKDFQGPCFSHSSFGQVVLSSV